MKSDDDEIKRQLYTEQIKLWIRQAEEDIIALKGFFFVFNQLNFYEKFWF